MAIELYRPLPDRWPWTHIAVGQRLSFKSAEVWLNNPSLRIAVTPGPIDDMLQSNGIPEVHPSERARFVLAQGADLTLGWEDRPANPIELRAAGIADRNTIRRIEPFPRGPIVDRAFFRALAISNTANAELNRTVGTRLGDRDLARKQDANYSELEFQRVLQYLRLQPQLQHLTGVIYVRGHVPLRDGQQLYIEDGALITDGFVAIERNSRLEVTHSVARRNWPAVIALEERFALGVGIGSELRAHGLVLANGIVDFLEGAKVDIVGAVVANGRGLSFRNQSATTTIRYDPAVLGTPGLQAAANDSVVAWVATWKELP
jgi:hypothetical protein